MLSIIYCSSHLREEFESNFILFYFKVIQGCLTILPLRPRVNDLPVVQQYPPLLPTPFGKTRLLSRPLQHFAVCPSHAPSNKPFCKLFVTAQFYTIQPCGPASLLRTASHVYADMNINTNTTNSASRHRERLAQKESLRNSAKRTDASELMRDYFPADGQSGAETTARSCNRDRVIIYIPVVNVKFLKKKQTKHIVANVYS